MLAVPIGTVMSRISRGRKQLYQLLSHERRGSVPAAGELADRMTEGSRPDTE